jgi:hypothetical protein
LAKLQEEGAKDSLALKKAKEELGEVRRGYISELKGLQGRWKEELKGGVKLLPVWHTWWMLT